MTEGGATGADSTDAASTAATARAATRQAQREARRAELVTAVTDLIRREGPFVSMEQMAAACGVTKPILYRHFGDREGLVAELAHVFVDDLLAMLAQTITPGRSALELLAATTDGYLAIIERDPDVYRFITTNVGAGRLDLMATLIIEQIAVVIERILAERDLPTEPARTWAAGLVGMVHFAAGQWIDDDDVPRAVVVERLTSLLWVGFDGLGIGDGPVRDPSGPIDTTAPNPTTPTPTKTTPS